jgi:hypothetical protein
VFPDTEDAQADAKTTLPNALPSLSTFFKKGLGRFSSSARSYSGAGRLFTADSTGTHTGLLEVVRCCLRLGTDFWRVMEEDFDAALDKEDVEIGFDGGPVEAALEDETEVVLLDDTRLVAGRCAEERNEGFLNLVGATLPFPLEVDDRRIVAVEDPEPEDVEEPASHNSGLSLSFSLSFHSFSFLALGLGGGLSASDSALAALSLLSSLNPFPSSDFACSGSDLKISAKPSPTLGLWLNSFTSSVGEGVARVSPVAVRMTPFMAEGRLSV